MKRKDWIKPRPKRAACYDCGLDYRKFPLDALCHNDIWELISPSEHSGGGLLCPNCICARLAKLGACCVFIVVSKQHIGYE